MQMTSVASPSRSAIVGLHRGVAAAMQHQARIAPEQARRVDAQREIGPDAVAGVAIHHRLRVTIDPGALHGMLPPCNMRRPASLAKLASACATSRSGAAARPLAVRGSGDHWLRQLDRLRRCRRSRSSFGVAAEHGRGLAHGGPPSRRRAAPAGAGSGRTATGWLGATAAVARRGLAAVRSDAGSGSAFSRAGRPAYVSCRSEGGSLAARGSRLFGALIAFERGRRVRRHPRPVAVAAAAIAPSAAASTPPAPAVAAHRRRFAPIHCSAAASSGARRPRPPWACRRRPERRRARAPARRSRLHAASPPPPRRPRRRRRRPRPLAVRARRAPRSADRHRSLRVSASASDVALFGGLVLLDEIVLVVVRDRHRRDRLRGDGLRLLEAVDLLALFDRCRTV